jgi:putative DNA primase/helicase
MGSIDAETQRHLAALKWVDDGRRALENHARTPKQLRDELTAAVEALELAGNVDDAEAEVPRVQAAIQNIKTAGRRTDGRAVSSPGAHHPPSVAHAGEHDGARPGGDSSNDALPLKISVVHGVNASEPIRLNEKSWGELAGILEEPQERSSKTDCRLLKLVTFGDKPNAKGNLRHNANVGEVYGLVGDYDGGEVSLEEGARRAEAAGIEALFYTTPSHTPDAPRFRVLAPLSKPHHPDDYPRLTDRLNGALGGILAGESWTMSQVFYFGRVRGVPYEFKRTRGRCIDLVDVQSIGKASRSEAPKPAAAPSESNGDLERAAAIAAATDETMRDLEPASMFLAEKGLLNSYTAWWNRLGEALTSLKGTPFEARAREIFLAASDKAGNEKYEGEAAEKWDGAEPAHTILYTAVFKDAQAAGWVNPRSAAAQDYSTLVDRTDVGNANLLAQLTDGDLRFVPEKRLWISWDGDKWIEDVHGGLAQGAALKVAQHYHAKRLELAKRAADEALDAGERKRILAAVESVKKWEGHCRNRRTIDAMLAVASRFFRMQVPFDSLNRDPYLLGAANGVVDLRTGTLRPAARDDLVTKRCPVAFNPQAVAPRWCAFIDEITGTPLPVTRTSSGQIDPASVGQFKKRPGLATYMRRALGYGLTGSVAEHKIFVAIGSSANGKNVMLDTAQHVAGDYWVTISPEALMTSRHDADAERPTPTAASLAGARAAISSESRDGQRLDVALVKRHTGGGYMTARQMRENPFRFQITHKLWLMTNHQPVLDHLDDAIRGRLHLIPFERQWNRPGHPERDPALPDGDKDLPEKLRAEAEGILAWLVAGAVAYLKEGLEPPAEVMRRTREYFRGQDLLGQWLELYERCEAREGEKGSLLFQAFANWCDEQDETSYTPNTQTGFSIALQRRGFAGAKTKAGIVYGLRLRADVEAEALV